MNEMHVLYGGIRIHGRSGNVALFLTNVVLANAALFAAIGALARRALCNARFLSIVVDIVNCSGLQVLTRQ